MTEQYDGIVNPPLDRLLEKVDSKYALVLFGAQRARQINAYYSQLHEGVFEYLGPMVDTKLNEKPLSISLREIDEGLLEMKPADQATESLGMPEGADMDSYDMGNAEYPFDLPTDADGAIDMDAVDMAANDNPDSPASDA